MNERTKAGTGPVDLSFPDYKMEELDEPPAGTPNFSCCIWTSP